MIRDIVKRNPECQCTYNFTCRYCLQNAKPYFFTLTNGTRIYELPAFVSQPGKIERHVGR